MLNTEKAKSLLVIKPAHEQSSLRFIKAYASLERFDGRCRLVVLWKHSKTKQMEKHHYELRFNHEGIKDFSITRFYGRQTMDWLVEYHLEEDKEPLFSKICLTEAAALLQDAYQQNIRFKTRPAKGINKEDVMFQQDTRELSRDKLWYKLSLNKLPLTMFVHIYLATLRRIDSGLFYDLSSSRRQQKLGQRKVFLHRGLREYCSYTFLRSDIIWLNEGPGLLEAAAYIIFRNSQEQVVKTEFRITLEEKENKYYVDSFKVVGEEYLNEEHPDNPLYYRVICSLYGIDKPKIIRERIERQQGIFLNGELDNICCYRRTKGELSTNQAYCIHDSTVGEVLISESELIVLAQKPHNLMEMESWIISIMGDLIKLQRKYYLPIKDFYGILGALSAMDIFTTPSLGGKLTNYKVDSAFIRAIDRETLWGYLQERAEGILPFNNRSWHASVTYNSEDSEQYFWGEYYITTGNWIKINCFRGDMEGEIIRLKSRLKGVKVVYTSELEDYFDLFTPPISDKRKWQIFGLLKSLNKEAPAFRELQIVPSLREAAIEMGALKKHLVN